MAARLRLQELDKSKRAAVHSATLHGASANWKLQTISPAFNRALLSWLAGVGWTEKVVRTES